VAIPLRSTIRYGALPSNAASQASYWPLVSLKPTGIATHNHEPPPTQGGHQSSKQQVWPKVRSEMIDGSRDRHWKLATASYLFLLKGKREIGFFLIIRSSVFILIVCGVFSLFVTFLLDAVKDWFYPHIP
jgi:hypothetical protein